MYFQLDHSRVSYERKLCIVEVRPFPDLSSSMIRCGARNGIVQTASLRCFSLTPCLRAACLCRNVELFHCRIFACFVCLCYHFMWWI